MSINAKAIVTIANRLGLHARPAMALVDVASGFDASVAIRRVDDPAGESVDGKSIMQVMMLAATQGTELELLCEGTDAEACCAALAELVARGFDED